MGIEGRLEGSGSRKVEIGAEKGFIGQVYHDIIHIIPCGFRIVRFFGIFFFILATTRYP